MVVVHGRIPDLRRARVLVLPVLFFLLSCFVVGLHGGEKTDQGKEPLAPKDERLRERNRYGQETAKLRKEGKIQEAIEACAKMLAIEREVFGDFHEDLIGSLEQLAQMHERLGDFEAAEKDLREVLSIREKLHEKDHWRVTDARLSLKDLKRRSGLDPQERSELKEAEKLNVRILDLSRKGRSAEAMPLAERASELWGRLLGKEDPKYALSLFNLGLLHKTNGDFRRAEEAYRQASDIWRKALGEEHPDYAASVNNLATLYHAMGDYARAEPLCRKALELAKKTLGEEHPDYAASVNNLAALHQDMGDYAGAEPLFRQAIEIRKKTLGEEHRDYAASLNSLASLYQDMGDYPRAEPLLREALEIRRKALGQEHPSYAASLNNLASLYQDMTDYARAEPLLREALEIRKKTLGEEHRDYATSLNNLALLYKDVGDYSRAERLFRQALEIRKRALGEEHPSYATTLSNFATLYQAMGDYARAVPLYRQALEIRKKALGEAHPSYAANVNSLAVLYKAMGDYARAEPLYRRALEIRKTVLGEEHPDCAVSLNNLAVLYNAMGDCARAEPLLRQASQIWRKTLGEEHPDYATSLNNLATLYQAMGDYALAEPLFRQASEIFRKALGEEHIDYATSLNNLALLYRYMREYARAEPLYRQSLEIQKNAIGEEHPDYAAGLRGLATLYYGMGDFARAEPLYRQSLEIQKNAIGEEHPDYAAGLGSLATLYNAQGDFARAEPLLRDALQISRRNLELASSVQSERQQLAMAGSLRWALDAYLSMGFRAGLAATRLYEEALPWKGAVYTRQHRQKLERSRPELRSLFVDLEGVSRRLAQLAFSDPEPRKRLAWKGQIEDLTERKEKIEGELSSKCAEYAREKALVRLSPAEIQGALPQDVALVDFLEYTQFSRREVIGRGVIEGRQSPISEAGPGADAGEGGAADRRAERPERAEANTGTEAGTGEEAKASEEAKPSPEAKASREGAPNDARKGPGRAQLHLAAFVILKDAPVVGLDLGPLAPIQKAIDAWRGAIAAGQGLKSEVEAATALRESLWQPLEKRLSGRRIVLVSPDGALGRIPFGALPGSKPGTYLIEEVSIALLPVPQMLPDLLEGGKPGGATPSLLLVGDVDFDAGSPGPDLAAAQGTKADSSKEDRVLRGEVRDAPRGGELLRFEPLDFTRGEIVMVADTFEGAREHGKLSRLCGKDATEAAIREAAAQHEYLHLATHGFFAPGELRSALAPSKAEGIAGPQPGLGPASDVTGWHPGLLSGIVLAGVNRRPDPERDDGILTALELATLDLGRTELMVLSACETGLGATAGGEGLLGLERAAQVAGARTVIASLWKVGDLETQKLMARFYENVWKRNMPKLEALREAQLGFLRGGLDGGTSLAARGAGEVVVRPGGEDEGKPLRASPRAWAAWVLSGDWR